MRLNRFIFAGLFFLGFFVSCDKDDDGNPEIVPPRDRGEQEIADQEALQDYLATHFYNYEEFENPGEDFDYMVQLDTISGDNTDKTPLIQMPNLKSKTFTYQEVEYTMYILTAREGLGEQPKFTDSTFVNYRGELLNGKVFDGSSTPIWFDLVSVIPGFSHSLTEFKGGFVDTINPDNTVSWKDFGVGTVFLPSGLGYFNQSNPAIPSYSPLVFNIQMLSIRQTDHDNDGIPSYMEDLNENGIVTDDDTDGDRVPNFGDPDDDGDFTPTRNEIEISEDGTVTFLDTNENGIPDHLDEEVW